MILWVRSMENIIINVMKYNNTIIVEIMTHTREMPCKIHYAIGIFGV